MNPDDYHLVKIGWAVDYILLPASMPDDYIQKVLEINGVQSKYPNEDISLISEKSKCIQCGNKSAMTLHLETNGTGDFCMDCLEDLVDIGITTLKGVAQ